MWLPGTGSRPPLRGWMQARTDVAMVAVRPGDHVLVIGAADPGLAASLALVAGLNGAVTVTDDQPQAAQRVASAAMRAGALVTFDAAAVTRLAAATDHVDMAVLVDQLGSRPETDRHACAAEALRIVRPGGRLVAIERPPAGLFGLFRQASARLSTEEICQVLTLAGWRAPRAIAERGGTVYVEAIKPR